MLAKCISTVYPVSKCSAIQMTRPTMTKQFCFTANNFSTEEEKTTIKSAFACGDDQFVTYCIMGYEGVGKTPHIQGFTQVAKACRWTKLNKLLPGGAVKKAKRTAEQKRWQGWHWENKVRNSTNEEARDYCKKEGDWEEWGEFSGSKQGRRTDLVDVAELIATGADKATIFKAHPSAFLKYRSNIVQTIGDLQEESALQRGTLEVIVLWGPTGLGKTHMALESAPKGTVYMQHGEDLKKGWWPGYKGETTLVLDDWTPSSCSVSTMLKLLDKYKCVLAVKGAHSWAAWTTVYITTNLQWPEDIYTGARPAHRAALFRRVTQVHHITKGYRERTPIMWDQFGLHKDKEEKTPEPMDVEVNCNAGNCIHGMDSAVCSAAKHSSDPPIRKPILHRAGAFIFLEEFE